MYVRGEVSSYSHTVVPLTGVGEDVGVGVLLGVGVVCCSA